MADRVSRRSDGKQLISKEHNGTPHAGIRKLPLPQRPTVTRAAPPLAEASTIQLVEAAVKETRELVRLEFALAKLEAKHQLKSAVKSAVVFGLAALLATITLCLLAVAIVLALGGTPAAALLVALGVLVLGGICGAVAFKLLPKHALERTRQHLEDDFKQLKEHVA